MENQTKWIVGSAAVLVIGLIIWALQTPGQEDGEQPAATEVVAGDWVKGNENASVTLIEYTDFECPACAAYFPIVKQLATAYPDDLRVVVRHYPLIQIHKNALSAARAAEAAGKQGKFFEMHDLLFEKQKEWSKLPDPKDTYITFAETLSLNKDQFVADMESGAIDDHINWSLKAGDNDGVQGTPTFVLNGERIANPGSLEAFKALIDAELGKEEEETPVEESVESQGAAVHEHADLKVYLEGKMVDFSQDKYQSLPDNALAENIHLHDKNPNIVHKHRSGVTLGEFFASLKMGLTKGCFRMDTGEAYCSGPTNTLKIWVNGQPSEKFDTFEFADGDRILVSYGSEDTKALEAQMDSVTRDSCIYSEKCPERGTPPTEECVGGLGTDCAKE